MKSILRLLLFASLVNVACKKENHPAVSEGPYFFTANLNGVPTTFNTTVGAITGGDNRSPNLLIVTGRSGELHPREIPPSFSLILNDNAPLTSKSYIAGLDPVHAGYSLEEMMPYNAEPGFEISINQLSSTEIRGSFNGKLKGSAGDIVEISDGRFFARINR